MERTSKHFRKRDAILNCVRSTATHPSAEWVFENGEPAPVCSVASGLDYPSSGRGDKDMDYVLENYGIR